MPRPKAKKAPKESKVEKVESKVESNVEKVESKVESNVEKAQKTPRKPRKKEEKTVVVDSVTTEDVETEDATESSEKQKKKRLVPTRESVEQEFDELMSFIDAEVVRLRESTAKSKGVKFLRSVGKKIKTLRSHALRVSKQRKSSTRKNNNNSGFNKPVMISKELAKFAGWNSEEPRSRVDVTKFVCKYIQEHGLQNPDDRRQIRVESDKALKKLLKYDSTKDNKPLTYYSLQTYLKNHFVKGEESK